MNPLSPYQNILLFLLTLIMTPSAFAAELGLIAPSTLGEEKGWILLDCRPDKKYQQAHLPGALPFSWETFTSTDRDGVKYRILPPEELADRLGRMGIGEQSGIVLYGDADSSWGGEGWGAWVFTWLGHRGPVRILAGGIQAWQRAGLPVEKESPEETRIVPYHLDLKPTRDISAEQLAGQTDRYTIVDVRSTLEWLRGHLPGAVHLPWEKFYQGPDRSPISREQLRKLLATHGVDLNKPVVYYCTGGIRSGYAWMVHELSGLGTAINFEGGTEAWDKRQP